MIIHTIEARTHGRYLIDVSAATGPLPMLVGFHGHAENAEMMFDNLRAIAPSGWCLLSVQALHRFYTRKGDVVATWMTRQDRELEIADNTAYVWSVVRDVERTYATRRPRVFVGFSQGVAMAYRAAAAGECDGLILLAGDVPPDVAPCASMLPPILLARGNTDDWYTQEKVDTDLRLLHAAGAKVIEHVFEGGHAWHDSFTARARVFLRALT